jgi:hypothetical protein
MGSAGTGRGKVSGRKVVLVYVTVALLGNAGLIRDRDRLYQIDPGTEMPTPDGRN